MSAKTCSSLVRLTKTVVIDQATAEPTTNAITYQNHWITKSMSDSP
jgi:hypothetical protein